MNADAPNNIVIWCMHRSGGTHFGQRMAHSMASKYGKLPNTANLGEATGSAGFIREGQGIGGIWNEMHTQLHMGTEFFIDHVKWTLDENNFLQAIDGYYGSVNEEIASRVKILKDRKWKNHVVFRNLRWPKMKSISTVYDSAILEGDFHHVVLWRQDLFAWFCSRAILRMTGVPHGDNLQYTGLEYMFNSDDAMLDFLATLDNYASEFKDSLKLLPAHKTVMVETTKMNSIDHIMWPDGKSLGLVDAENVRRGNTVWKNRTTGERILPPEMIDIKHRKILHTRAKQLEQALDWENLAQQFGFKPA